MATASASPRPTRAAGCFVTDRTLKRLNVVDPKTTGEVWVTQPGNKRIKGRTQ